MPALGVLALQGDFEAHATALRCAGHVRRIRRCQDLAGLDALVIPGGESTTLLKLMADEPWLEALRRFHDDGGALFGTCAGAILLAREVAPQQPSLGLIDIAVERNAYGRQAESFETPLLVPALGAPPLALDAVFIRAPRIRSVGGAVEVLARLGDEPVLVRQGRVWAATFHPELSATDRLHRWFVEEIGAGAARRSA